VEESKISKIKAEVEKNRDMVSSILTTRPENENKKRYNIHAIPSHFDTNVLQ